MAEIWRRYGGDIGEDAPAHRAEVAEAEVGEARARTGAELGKGHPLHARIESKALTDRVDAILHLVRARWGRVRARAGLRAGVKALRD